MLFKLVIGLCAISIVLELDQLINLVAKIVNR